MKSRRASSNGSGGDRAGGRPGRGGQRPRVFIDVGISEIGKLGTQPLRRELFDLLPLRGEEEFRVDLIAGEPEREGKQSVNRESYKAATTHACIPSSPGAVGFSPPKMMMLLTPHILYTPSMSFVAGPVNLSAFL
jgi:hypothetical protein